MKARPRVLGSIEQRIYLCSRLDANDYRAKRDFIREVCFYEGTSSTGSMKTLMGLNQDLAGRHVVIVEDIVDSGFTMAHMIEDLKKMNPASIEICSSS